VKWLTVNLAPLVVAVLAAAAAVAAVWMWRTT
jgi:hypothetical protein